ncbi:MAG: HlyD family efflux transporter periplasmic adaptor subunit [Thiobacillaceae bacterium]|nr:HlyD family efflux transporter periplasmic adaptor subunit [Thiobacillaceae bacterium]
MKRLLLPLVVLAVGVGGLIALKATRPKPAAAAVQEQVWRIEAQTVQPATLSPVLRLYARVESPELMRAAAPGTGRVAAVHVREGQLVRKGELLLALDARDFVPRVEQARAQVEEIEAARESERLRHAADLEQIEQERRLLELAVAELARHERLRQEGFYSEAAVDQARQALARQRMSLRSRELSIADHAARLRQLDARLEQARANLQQAELAATRSRVIAPFDGVVAQVQVAEGDQVGAGQVLLTLYPLRDLELRAKLPAPQQAEVEQALRQGGRLQAQALMPQQRLPLRLVRLAGAADARGVDAFFRPEVVSTDLRLGALVSIELLRPPVQGAFALPATALHGGRFVYKVVAGRIQAVPVHLVGELPGERPMLIVQAEGLQRGDTVMLTHLPQAVSGLRVEVMRR